MLAQRRGGRLRLGAMQSFGPLTYSARPAISELGAADLRASSLVLAPLTGASVLATGLLALQFAGGFDGPIACRLAGWLAGWLCNMLDFIVFSFH